MPRRVLLAEQDDTIRGVAETVLRQNGFDVIAVSNPDKLFEILELSTPDLFLIDANMTGGDNQPTYMKLKANAKASQLPLVLLADEYTESLGLPAQAVVLRPFDPANLLSQINNMMVSPSTPDPKVDPLAGGSLDDEFLDSALGLDNLEVTGSEDMNKTGLVRVQSKGENTKIMGIGQFEQSGSGKDTSDSSRVESLMISDEHSDISSSPKTPKDSLQETSGLQLADDQYGLSDPNAFHADDNDANHDYNWFVNSMKSDNDDSSGGFGAPSPPSTTGGDDLNFTDSAGMLDPVTPGPGSAEPTTPPPVQPEASADQSSGGMDKFIDEFRQEVEKLGDGGPESIVIPQEDPGLAESVSEAESSAVAVQTISEEEQALWEDRIENVTPEHLRIFTRELAGRLADKIAGLILARIDQDKLLQLIKDELVKEIRKKS